LQIFSASNFRCPQIANPIRKLVPAQAGIVNQKSEIGNQKSEIANQINPIPRKQNRPGAPPPFGRSAPGR